MALVAHSGTAALDLLDHRERQIRWIADPSDAATYDVGDVVWKDGQQWQITAVSYATITGWGPYGDAALVSTASGMDYPMVSTSTRHGVYLSNTIRTRAPVVVLPPPPGPPVDLEPPVWPLWLRLLPPTDQPPPVCLEIPAVGDLIFHPQMRGGELIDPMTRLTPSEMAAQATRQREARQAFQAMESAQQVREQSRWWKFWGKRVA